MSQILVTKPFQAPFEETAAEIKRAWDAQWLTNNGPLLCEYEQQLNAYLGTRECAVVGNGTLAIQLAMRALGVKDEVITTPFSYVATTSSIVWEGCIPVFVDVDATTFNIDPVKIEASIRGKCDYKTASDASPEYVYQMTNYFSNFISESRSF
jgi:dTDP-4-amino-4,6-dideoxygalactose transaminase